MNVFLMLNANEDILKNVGDQMLVAIDLHNVFFLSVQWTSMAISNFSKYLMCSTRKKIIQVWNHLRVSKWWINYIFKFAIVSHQGFSSSLLPPEVDPSVTPDLSHTVDLLCLSWTKADGHEETDLKIINTFQLYMFMSGDLGTLGVINKHLNHVFAN